MFRCEGCLGVFVCLHMCECVFARVCVWSVFQGKDILGRVNVCADAAELFVSFLH